jgi:hypothetical protein
MAANEAGIACRLFLLGLKVYSSIKKLQPISSRDNPPSRLQFFNLQTETYLYEVKQKIEIIFAQPISHILLYGVQILLLPNKNQMAAILLLPAVLS